MKNLGAATVREDDLLERILPMSLVEAVFAGIDLYAMQHRDQRLQRPTKVRLSWRGGSLRSVAVHGLCDPFHLPSLDPDVMDVAITLQGAGFDPDEADPSVWVWYAGVLA